MNIENFLHETETKEELLSQGYDLKSAWLSELTLMIASKETYDVFHKFEGFYIYQGDKKLFLKPNMTLKQNCFNSLNDYAVYTILFKHNWDELAAEHDSDLDFDFDAFMEERSHTQCPINQIDLFESASEAHFYHHENEKSRCVNLTLGNKSLAHKTNFLSKIIKNEIVDKEVAEEELFFLTLPQGYDFDDSIEF